MSVPEPERHIVRAPGVALVIVFLAGCGLFGSDKEEEPDAVSQPDATGSQRPDGLTLDDDFLLRLDTTTPLFTAPFPGLQGMEVHGVLADDQGRREIRVVRPSDGASQVIAAADWNLPAVGAALGGVSAICYNRLVGSPTELTEGSAPDPTQGVELSCRIDDGSGWGDPVVVGGESRAAWLVGVDVGADGSVGIDYYRDDGWFIPTQPDHGIYRQIWAAGSLGEPQLIEAGLGEIPVTIPPPR